ncbi:hypothetical protein HY988_06745 [Candidatus Micrarchaeota archaeon]|nr:hypothetical protein [Candidatus Micrarchaeota archaeon]
MEVELEGKHILSALAIALMVGIIFAIVGFGLSYLSNNEYPYLQVFSMLLFFQIPLMAFLFLWGEKKKDVTFCRSVSVASFFISVFLMVFFILLRLTNQSYSLTSEQFLRELSALLYSAVRYIGLYLWMLIFLQPSPDRLKKAFLYSVIAIICLSLLGNLANVLFNGVNFGIFFSFDPYSASFLLSQFIVVIPILYQTMGKKLDMDAAYTFTALMIGSSLFYVAANLDVVLSGNLMIFKDLSLDLALLGLLYLFSDKNIDKLPNSFSGETRIS